MPPQHRSHAPSRPPAPGQELELEVDSLAQGGRGVARADGYVVFVSGALPGDRVRARLTKVEARLRRGERRSSSSRPSAERIADACVHEGEPCPGAPWQGLPYERQLAEKRDPGRRGAAPPRPPRRLRARADRARGRRVALPQQARVLVRRAAERLALGFHRRGSWAEIVDVDDCQLASEANNAARNAVRELGARRAA